MTLTREMRLTPRESIFCFWATLSSEASSVVGVSSVVQYPLHIITESTWEGTPWDSGWRIPGSGFFGLSWSWVVGLGLVPFPGGESTWDVTRRFSGGWCISESGLIGVSWACVAGLGLRLFPFSDGEAALVAFVSFLLGFVRSVSVVVALQRFSDSGESSSGDVGGLDFPSFGTEASSGSFVLIDLLEECLGPREVRGFSLGA